MNFYPFHIGDYASHTNHLTDAEDLAYRRMIDLYYMNEQPFNNCSTLARRVKSNVEVVQIILDEFFELQDDGCWHNKRIDEEIAKYQAIQNKKSQAGKASAAARTKSNTCSTSVEPTKNQEPLTKNYIKTIGVAKATKAKRLDLETLPVEWDRFCKTERPELNPQEVFAQFRDYWIAQGGQRGCKLDWLATWRNWVRNQKASIKTKQDQGNEAFHQLTGGMLKPKPNDAVFQSIAQTVDMENDHARLR